MRAAQPIAAFSGSVSAQSDWFSRLAVHTAILTGKPITFLGAVAVVAIWAVTGPLFHFSDTWQLVINTGTTIITFLMVFLIQATQNRDTLALQIKLSELILALEGARNELAAVEKQPEKRWKTSPRIFTPARTQTPLTTQSNRVAARASTLLADRLGREKAQQHDRNKPLPPDAAPRLKTDPHHPGVEQRRAAAPGRTLERGTLPCVASAQRRASQGAGGNDQKNSGCHQRPKYGPQLDRRPGIEADTQEDERSKRGEGGRASKKKETCRQTCLCRQPKTKEMLDPRKHSNKPLRARVSSLNRPFKTSFRPRAFFPHADRRKGPDIAEWRRHRNPTRRSALELRSCAQVRLHRRSSRF